MQGLRPSPFQEGSRSLSLERLGLTGAYLMAARGTTSYVNGAFPAAFAEFFEFMNLEVILETPEHLSWTSLLHLACGSSFSVKISFLSLFLRCLPSPRHWPCIMGLGQAGRIHGSRATWKRGNHLLLGEGRQGSLVGRLNGAVSFQLKLDSVGQSDLHNQAGFSPCQAWVSMFAGFENEKHRGTKFMGKEVLLTFREGQENQPFEKLHRKRKMKN